MTNYDDYFTNEDKPFSENLNSSLLLSNAFDGAVTIEMPKMFNNGSFVNNTTPRKCGVAIVTLRTTLPSGITINNNGDLSGTGTVQLKFYPNFNNFGKIRSISWDDADGITINLKKLNGTVIASNINNGVIESEDEELRKMQEIIIEVVLNNATLTNFEVTMQSKQSDRYGADAKVDSVDGLDTRLGNIEDKKDDQEERLGDIESLDITQNTRLVTIENTLDLIRNYKIKPSSYNPKIDTNITVSVEVRNKSGNLMPYTSINLSYTRSKPNTYPYENLTTNVTGQTNENGVATFTINMNNWGTWDFQVGDEHCQVYVDGWRLILGSTSGTYQIYRNKTHGKFIMKKVSASDVVYEWKNFANGATAASIPPQSWVITPIGSGDILIKIDYDGTISYRSTYGYPLHNRELWGQIEWEIYFGDDDEDEED